MPGVRVKAPVALFLALIAVAALVATAAAEPPASRVAYDGPFDAVTIPIPSPDARVRAVASPPPPSGSAAPPAAVVDPGNAPVPTKAPRHQPAAELGVVVKPTPTPKPVFQMTSTGHSLSGTASWYCNNDGSRAQISACHYDYPDTGAFNAYGAAGPRLRAALGSGWRNRIVSVDGVRVKLVDWCQCYEGKSNEKLLDLYLDVYRVTGGQVTVRW